MTLQKSLDERLDETLKQSFPAFDMPTTFELADEDEDQDEEEDDEDEDEDEDDEDEDEEEDDEE